MCEVWKKIVVVAVGFRFGEQTARERDHQLLPTTPGNYDDESTENSKKVVKWRLSKDRQNNRIVMMCVKVKEKSSRLTAISLSPPTASAWLKNRRKLLLPVLPYSTIFRGAGNGVPIL